MLNPNLVTMITHLPSISYAHDMCFNNEDEYYDNFVFDILSVENQSMWFLISCYLYTIIVEGMPTSLVDALTKG